MVRRSVTPLQASGYRFLMRRMEYALVCRDTRMLDDPIRAQSVALGVGVAITAVIVAGCAVLALLRPHGSLGDDPIVVVRESGDLYVRVGGLMHPVPNLTSAQLIVGNTRPPRQVSAAMMANADRGPLMGIAGAPASIAPAVPPDQQAWTVCDDREGSTTLRIGVPAELPVAPALLVTAAAERAPGTYLLHAGRRAVIDLRHRAVIRALRLDGIVPLRVSAALLDALPVTASIATPRIPGAGTRGPAGLQDFRVGQVLRVARAGAADHYVVLADGVQRVAPVVADLIRFATRDGDESIPDVPADRVSSVPVVDAVDFPDLPATAVSGAELGTLLCARWQWRPAGQESDTVLLTSDTAVAGKELVQADGAGPHVDAVSVPTGRSLYVRATGIAGEGMASGPRYLITDSGVTFGVSDPDSARALGLDATPAGAPWPLLALLPRGPELSVVRASVLRDSLAAPS